MKTFFDPVVQKELEDRLEKLKADHPRQWGRMDVAQMLAHCSAGMGMPLGHLKVKWVPISLIGWLWKGVITDGKPFRRGVPTARELTMAAPRDVETERAILRGRMRELAQGPEAIQNFRHPFFGRLTAAQWGILSYKHLDHHFSQFGG